MHWKVIRRGVRWCLARPVLVLAVAVGLFVFRAGAFSLTREFWRDEAWTVMTADVPPSYEGWWPYYKERILPMDVNPPLYYAIVRLATRLVPTPPRTWRLLSTFAVVAAALCFYRLGRQWGLSRTALPAVVLLLCHDGLVAVGVELRCYAVLLLAIAIAALQVKPIVEKPRPYAEATVFFLMGLAGLGLHYTYVFLLGGFCLFALARMLRGERRSWRLIGLSATAGAVFVLLWGNILFAQKGSYEYMVVEHVTKRFLKGLSEHIVVPLPVDGWLVGLILLAFWVVYLLPKAWKGSGRASRRAAFFLAMSGGFSLLLYLAAFVVPLLATRGRYYLPSLPFTCLAVTALFFVLPRFWRRSLAVIAALLVLFSLRGLLYLFPPSQYHLSVIQEISASRPDLIAYYTGDDHAQELNAYYYDGLQNLEKMALWHPRKTGEPLPNPSFRHRIGEFLTELDQKPSALKKENPPGRVLVMIERGAGPAEKRDAMLEMYRLAYANEETLRESTRSISRSCTLILFWNAEE